MMLLYSVFLGITKDSILLTVYDLVLEETETMNASHSEGRPLKMASM